MSEFLKSAMGYFNTTPNTGSGNSSTTSTSIENEFCGQIVEIAGQKLRVQNVIAEGGFAIVYVAQNIQSGKQYALKRLIGADKQACQAIINEINTHKQLSGHPNVVSFVGATFIDKTTKPQQRAEYFLLTELCTGGSLIDCLTLSSTLDPQVVLRIFYQASRAVAHIHSQSPPITHRDIKIENFLLGSDKNIKLCDFGSATQETFSPTLEWGAQQRNLLEDQLSCVTTPMYRAPEMLDTWSNYEINTKVDIWALGCVLYMLCFQKHPFEDSAKLRIVNGNYVIPSDSRFNCFHEIIKGCLIVNPAERFNISMILERLAALSETRNWSLKSPLEELQGKPIITRTQTNEHLNGLNTTPAAANITPSAANTRSSPLVHTTPPVVRAASSKSIFYTDDPTSVADVNNRQQQQQPSNNNGSLLSSIRGGAGSFLKNLKDTSSKVMQTMQQTIARTDLDISYITSRILVMPCPSEGFESAYKTNNIEDVRLSIESRFAPQKVSIYNFGPRSCPRLPPPVRTVEVGTIYASAQSHAPNLEGMFSVAEDLYSFLSADPKSTVIIQTGDSGGCTAATIVCALLMYSDLILEPEDAVQVFAVKRHPINLRPSEFRYLYYFGDILRPTPFLPHYKSISLVSLSCEPVPRMTKSRDGCRIYMEIYCNDRILLTTLQDYEKMRLYLAGPGSKIILPISLNVCGDLTIVMYHARGALKGMMRPQALKICQFQVNTGFIPEQETLINFTSNDLDDLPDAEHVPPEFTVSLSLTVTDSECPPSRNPPWLPAKPKRKPFNLFSTQLEYEEMLDNFVTKPSSSPPITARSTQSSFSVPPLIEEPKRSNSPLILPDVTEISHDIHSTNTIPEASPPIDLLNLNQPPSHHVQQDPQATAMPTTDASFDLLGAFGDDDSSGIGTAPIPDILADNSQPTTSAGLDDIFGSLGSAAPNFNLDFNTLPTSLSSSTEPKITPNASTSTLFGSIPSFTTNTSSKEPSPQQSNDPFADIANLASGFNISFNPNTLGNGKSAGTTPVGNSPYATNFSSPTHNQGSSTKRIPPAQMHSSVSPNHIKSPNGVIGGTSPHSQTNSGRPSPQPTSTSVPSSNLNNTQSQRPDYSRTHFETSKPSSQNAQTFKNADVFADILGQQGYKFGSKTNQGPRSINEMRKEDLIKDMDPDKVKIMEWTEGKKSNIRALLCSMHTVLWSDAKWSKCEMSSLITPADVKKSYRRACLAVHPDKHNGTDNEKIAKLIFIELNNAWTDFENDATQQNIFSS